MDPLTWLQHWYWDQCNGDWEHSYGVRIGTMDNPGWSVGVDLVGTELEGVPFEAIAVRRSLHDWYSCEVVEGRFVGYGGPANVGDIVTAFQSLAAQRQHQPDLVSAIAVGNVAAISRIAVDPTCLDLVDENGWTPLAIAVDGGDMAAAELLIALGADVNGRQQPDSAIPLAIEQVGPRRPHRWTPLAVAVGKGADMVSLLLQHGADPNAQDDMGRTPLHWAVDREAPDTEVVERLLGGGASVAIRDNEGRTPLQLATMRERAPLVRLLEDHC